MKTLKITMYFDVEDNAVDQVMKITHHADSLLDLDSWKNEIKTVYGVEVKDVTDLSD